MVGRYVREIAAVKWRQLFYRDRMLSDDIIKFPGEWKLVVC